MILAWKGKTHVRGKRAHHIPFPAVLILLILPSLMARAQQPQASAKPSGPLDDPLLQAADEERLPPDLFSHISLEYAHQMFSSGADSERVRIEGEQTFAKNRLGIGYEIPYLNIHGHPEGDDGAGLGDILLKFDLLLTKSERFSQAARVEFTFPSGSNDAVSADQNILKVAWAFSTPLSRRTVFSGILAYNKSLSAPSGEQGTNTLEPEAVLAHEFTKRLAGYLDWDTYQDFNADRFGQTLKAGLTIQLDRATRWTASPYAQFPLNHFTSSTNIKSELGFDLNYRY